MNVIKSLFQVDGKKLWYRNNEAEPEKSCGIATGELPQKRLLPRIAASRDCIALEGDRLGMAMPFEKWKI